MMKRSVIAAAIFAGTACAGDEAPDVLGASCAFFLHDGSESELLKAEVLAHADTVGMTLATVLPATAMDFIGDNAMSRCRDNPDQTLGDLLRDLVAEFYAQ